MSDARVMLLGVRLAFPTLNRPEKFDPANEKQEPRYSGTLLLDKEDAGQVAKIDAAIRAAAAAKWGEAKADAAVKGLTASLKIAKQDGELKADKYDGFEGNWAIAAHAKENAPPRLLDRDKTELPRDTPKLYAGCYVNASVEFWAQDNQFGKRINCQLRGVQFARDGDAFSGARPADTDEFDVVEGADEAASAEDFA